MAKYGVHAVIDPETGKQVYRRLIVLADSPDRQAAELKVAESLSINGNPKGSDTKSLASMILELQFFSDGNHGNPKGKYAMNAGGMTSTFGKRIAQELSNGATRLLTKKK